MKGFQPVKNVNIMYYQKLKVWRAWFSVFCTSCLAVYPLNCATLPTLKCLKDGWKQCRLIVSVVVGYWTALLGVL